MSDFLTSLQHTIYNNLWESVDRNHPHSVVWVLAGTVDIDLQHGVTSPALSAFFWRLLLPPRTFAFVQKVYASEIPPDAFATLSARGLGRAVVHSLRLDF